MNRKKSSAHICFGIAGTTGAATAIREFPTHTPRPPPRPSWQNTTKNSDPSPTGNNMNKPTPNYANPQLPAMVEEAFQLQRLLFNRAVEISSATGLKVGEILERIAHMCDCHEPSLEAFMAFDEDRPLSGTLRPQPKSLHSIVLTLQYCLETFEQNCQCGRCDPCSRGRNEIKQAIEMLEVLLDVRPNSGWALPRFFMEGQGVHAEFAD